MGPETGGTKFATVPVPTADVSAASTHAAGLTSPSTHIPGPQKTGSLEFISYHFPGL